MVLPGKQRLRVGQTEPGTRSKEHRSQESVLTVPGQQYRRAQRADAPQGGRQARRDGGSADASSAGSAQDLRAAPPEPGPGAASSCCRGPLARMVTARGQGGVLPLSVERR